MIDDEKLKSDIDLLAITNHDTELKLVAKTNGGEYAGACPFCGGKDRFRVQPGAKPYPLWMCRNCTDGKWDTIVGYVAKDMKLDPKLHYKEILARIAQISGQELQHLQHFTTTPLQHFTPAPQPADLPPGEDWQRSANKIIDDCMDRLWDQKAGRKALLWLRDRGLKNQTIEEFQLGYSPGIKVGDLWVPRGIVIPAVTGDEIWYIKIRLPARQGENKYIQVKGSRPAIFNADWLRGSPVALFTEGEFDCMIGHQELNQYLPVATLGSATTTPDLALWYWYFTPLQKILACYDNDEQGQKGFDRLHDLAGNRVKKYQVPFGKDLNDFYKDGHDLFDWVKPGIKEFMTVEW